jgi:hypothetical protein
MEILEELIIAVAKEVLCDYEDEITLVTQFEDQWCYTDRLYINRMLQDDLGI